jgi:hypothetical protein
MDRRMLALISNNYGIGERDVGWDTAMWCECDVV